MPDRSSFSLLGMEQVIVTNNKRWKHRALLLVVELEFNPTIDHFDN